MTVDHADRRTVVATPGRRPPRIRPARRPGGAVARAIHATVAAQRFVRGNHDRDDVQDDDIAPSTAIRLTSGLMGSAVRATDYIVGCVSSWPQGATGVSMGSVRSKSTRHVQSLLRIVP